MSLDLFIVHSPFLLSFHALFAGRSRHHRFRCTKIFYFARLEHNPHWRTTCVASKGSLLSLKKPKHCISKRSEGKKTIHRQFGRTHTYYHCAHCTSHTCCTKLESRWNLFGYSKLDWQHTRRRSTIQLHSVTVTIASAAVINSEMHNTIYRCPERRHGLICVILVGWAFLMRTAWASYIVDIDTRRKCEHHQKSRFEEHEPWRKSIFSQCNDWDFRQTWKYTSVRHFLRHSSHRKNTFTEMLALFEWCC